MQLATARRRMRAYMERHGGRATIQRKIGASWATLASDVPVMIEPRAGIGTIDPYSATSDSGQAPQLRFPWGTDLALGDRVELTATEGVVPGMVTISALDYDSLSVAIGASGTVEETAVETYTVTIERYSAATGGYVQVLTAEAQAVTTFVGEIARDEEGARGATRPGTLIFTPAPSVTIGVGDELLGIPWARAARTTAIRPTVGDRLEVEFTYTTGTA